jgi:hypothetical protein
LPCDERAGERGDLQCAVVMPGAARPALMLLDGGMSWSSRLCAPPRCSGVCSDGRTWSNRWNAAVGLGIAGGPGHAAGLMTTSLDGLVLDAVRDSDAGACCIDPAAAVPPHAGDNSARVRPELQMSWCSMKLSTLEHRTRTSD